MSKKNAPETAKFALASVSCFSGLDDVVLAAIAKITVLRHYERGEIVFLDGEPCEGMYIVQSGRLKGILASPGGREQIIRILGQGDAFNEHGVFTKEGCNLVTVQAIDASDVWLVNRSALLALMDQYPVLSSTITQNLASRIVHLMRLVEDLSLRTVEARLAHLLLEHCGNESGEHRWSTQAEMAARLGTVVDVINRALHKLQDEELIRIVRHRIEIIDPGGLEQKVEL